MGQRTDNPQPDSGAGNLFLPAGVSPFDGRVRAAINAANSKRDYTVSMGEESQGGTDRSIKDFYIENRDSTSGIYLTIELMNGIKFRIPLYAFRHVSRIERGGSGSQSSGWAYARKRVHSERFISFASQASPENYTVDGYTDTTEGYFADEVNYSTLRLYKEPKYYTCPRIWGEPWKGGGSTQLIAGCMYWSSSAQQQAELPL